MNIKELEATLPGGFHNALLRCYRVDLTAKTAHFRLQLCVGDPHSRHETIREAYRSADLVLSGLEYFFVDAPDPTYPREAPWQIDLCDPDPGFTARYDTPLNGFASRFYSSATNVFIHFAAVSAAIIYEDEQ